MLKGIRAENVLNLGKETGNQVQEAQRDPNKMNPKRSIPRCDIIKVSKIKDKRILKAARQKQLVICKGTYIRISSVGFQQKLCQPEWSAMLYSEC